MDLGQLSITDLKVILNQLPKEIERREKDEKIRARKELEVFAAERGFSLEELISDKPKIKERKPVEIKYRHLFDENLTWTGRGRQPKWLTSFLTSGGTLDQCKV